MLPHDWYFHHMYSCRRMDFSAHGPIPLLGPWDPSQGVHNPDEKIKLWLFLPGRQSTVADSAQAAVSKLRVAASGLWMSPGDSEEVAAALSQALRNRIQRALSGLAYMRFGDVFSKFHPSQSEELLRKGQPTVEFIFAASDEGIFVHALVSAKYVKRHHTFYTVKFPCDTCSSRFYWF